MIKQRVEGVPTAYLLGEKEFMSLTFEVNRQVLIPRPDTEVLVETALELLGERKNDNLTVVDVGTGSGNIAVVLARHLPNTQVLGIDYSESALEVAQRNAQRNGVEDRLTFYEGDLLSPLEEKGLKGQVDLIAANLPYISSDQLPHLMREVLQEPISALDGGRDGLMYYRRLLPQALDYLKPGGFLLIEIGMEQGRGAQKLFTEGWGNVQVKLDYAGRDRVVYACSTKAPASQDLRKMKAQRYQRAKAQA
jgi:release factor glutamine methyltransferase